MRVWVAEWQIGDSGSPWRVGDRLHLSLATQDDQSWISALTGEDAAAQIDYVMAGGNEDTTQFVPGRITSITEVTARYDSPHGGRVQPGTGELTTVQVAYGLRGDANLSEPTPVAYVVDIDVD
jgi:hypothetical protein